ncbi:MAG TPA: biopolymer transporter ExbD [Schlesneria sp.]
MRQIVTCDDCRQRYRLNNPHSGKTFACPSCGKPLAVPELTPAAVPPTQELAVPAADEAHAVGPLLKPAKKIDFEDLIDMTAMVDVVFFLLIYFLVTSLQAVDSAIDVPLPDASQGAGRQQAVANEQQPEQAQVTVRIDQADRITIEGNEVRGPDEVFLRLRELRAGRDRPSVLVVIGSGDATHGTLVSVLDSSQELGFEKIKLSVVDEPEAR